MKVLFLIIISLFVIFFSCTEEIEIPKNNISIKNDFSIREGKRLFLYYCSPCHGENGNGSGKFFGYGLKPKPPDFTTEEFIKNRNDELLILAISGGSISVGKSNLCPPWGNTFHKEEIKFLVDFIKKIKRVPKKSEIK
ncbi:MAG: cytochrome c [Bacteroidetes bacterium]|nr:cytochrome c [Bacteroidota bacterium]MCH8325326.1 cytochrome c [Bacteroidota bacterium]